MREDLAGSFEAEPTLTAGDAWRWDSRDKNPRILLRLDL